MQNKTRPYIGSRIIDLVVVTLASEVETVPLGQKRSSEMIAIAKKRYNKSDFLETIPLHKLRELSMYYQN